MARNREIADDLRRRIQTGEWQPGQQLPALEALAAHYQVPSIGTVRSAEKMLAADGLLRIEAGRGTFVLAPEQRDQRTVALAALYRSRAELDEAIRALEAEAG